MKKNDLVAQGKELGLSIQDIEVLILYNLNISKNDYFLLDKIDNSEKIITDFERIQEGYPVQYILNTCEFYGREFYVDKNVLIPRIDTELMIDCIKNNDYQKNTQYLDVGTGSGIIPITLSQELTGYKSISAFDISAGAIEIANKNINNYKLQENIYVYKADLLSEFNSLLLDKGDKIVITANLPYIKSKDYENMSESTVLHEPDLALYGGEETGFELYEKLIEQCIGLSLQDYDIDLFIEIGFDQKEVAQNFLSENQLDFEFHKDSATIDRVVEIHF